MSRTAITRPRGGPPVAGRSRPGGFTLVELLMVMALLGVLLGTGVGMLASLNLGRRAALGLCQNTLRAARNAAVARSAPAEVSIDRRAGTLVARSMEVVGTWQFEERLTGANDAPGVGLGATFTDDGFIGEGLAVGMGARAEFPVQRDPAWDFADGFAVECAVRIDVAGSLAVVDAGGAFGISVSGDLGGRGWFRPRVAGEDGAAHAGGALAVDLEPGTLELGRWHTLQLAYDRRVLSLDVDGVPRARESYDAVVWPLEGPLRVGDERAGGAASVDRLVVSAVAAARTVKLPDGVAFSEDTPALVRFEAGGRLDRTLHPRAVEFALEYEDGERAPLRIGLYGTVE